MKARARDVIRTVLPVESDFDDVTHAVGLLGDVVEAYSEPREAYAVDLAIPDPDLAGGYRYDNVLLTPDQFIVVMRYVEDETPSEARTG